MSLNEALIGELKAEANSTRKLLNKVPLDSAGWKPHEKSMTLSRLAAHVAELPEWVTAAIAADELDLANMRKSFVPETAGDLEAYFDKTVESAIAALSNAPAEEFAKPWTLRRGEHVIFTMPKAAVVRSFALNHMIHHRGQLSVYLRLLDVAIPGMYGPSADEKN